MNILIAKNLTKTYKNKNIIKNINLIIKSGEIVGLLGPNGAGKTTTFHMILGIIQPDSGHILINQKDITLLPLYLRAQLGLGYLPQENSIFRYLNVNDNIMAILEIRSDLTEIQRKNRSKELMKEFNISHLYNNLGKTLSGGERRRVEIARALAANPKFILLDEPFAGVDPISIIDIKKIIKKLRNYNLGILITDHNVRETLNICQRAYIVNNGKLIAHGTPNMILLNNHVKRVYLGEEFHL
ncbi:Lipopolysaccharide export system ATP-binding protein LptB [Serratia symbiotica]|nr:Lipopolysaccharide export system ATP-binding protein LptB [Serratia symbiotica]